jgi:polyisoprenoid-binding protein YceI
MKRLVPLLLALAAPAAAFPDASTWAIDPNHSQSMFTIRHLVITNVRGEFGKTTGMVTLDEKDIAKSRVEATIEVTTIDTRNADRDQHLRSPDFFDVAKHPAITFRSTKVEKAGEGVLRVTGDLTMRGVTRPVVLEVAGPGAEVKGMQGELRRAFSATARLNRRDFGLNWSKMVEAGPVVGDEVKVEIEAELVKAAAATQAKK